MSDRQNPAVDWELIDVSLADHDFGDRLPRAISIGTAGALEISSGADSKATPTKTVIPANALAVGVQHAIQPGVIYTANTDASEIVAWY